MLHFNGGSGEFLYVDSLQAGFDDAPQLAVETDGFALELSVEPASKRGSGMLPIFTQNMLSRAWRDTRDDSELFDAVYPYIVSLRFESASWIDDHVLLARLASPASPRSRLARREPVFATFDLRQQRVVSIHIDMERDPEYGRVFLATALRLTGAPRLGSLSLRHALMPGFGRDGETVSAESLETVMLSKAFESLPSPLLSARSRPALLNLNLFRFDSTLVPNASASRLAVAGAGSGTVRWSWRARADPTTIVFSVDIRQHDAAVSDDSASSDDDGFASSGASRFVFHPFLGIIVVSTATSLSGVSHFVYL